MIRLKRENKVEGDLISVIFLLNYRAYQLKGNIPKLWLLIMIERVIYPFEANWACGRK